MMQRDQLNRLGQGRQHFTGQAEHLLMKYFGTMMGLCTGLW